MTVINRKPRIALMGEFSAGKSTLSNLLLGTRPLPEKVTATRLSPVWMSYGSQTPFREDVNGTTEPVELDRLEGIDVEATRVIRLFFEADILQVCDLIDFPGISDPNMSSDVWQRMLCEVDAVLWCTHATQAWRQSEAAVWDTMPEAVRERSVLLVTRFDKLTTERDRARVLARLGKETEGLFGATFPISLTEALAAGDDYDAFDASGGGAFLEHLIPLIDTLSETVGGMEKTIFDTAAGDIIATSKAEQQADHIEAEPVAPMENIAEPEVTSPEPAIVPTRPATITAPAPVAQSAVEAPVIHVDSSEPVLRVEAGSTNVQSLDAGQRVMPRRVRASGETMTKRPRRPASGAQVQGIDALSAMQTPGRPAAASATQLRSIFTSEDGNEAEGQKDAG